MSKKLTVGDVFVENQSIVSFQTRIIDTIIFISEKKITVMRMCVPNKAESSPWMFVFNLDHASIISNAMNGNYWSSKWWIHI